MRRGVTHDMTKHRKNSWKILYMQIIFHTVTWQTQFSFYILHIFQLDRSIRQVWLKYCVTFDFGAWQRYNSNVLTLLFKLGDLCCFCSKLVKFVILLVKVGKICGQSWWNLWRFWWYVAKFLVLSVKVNEISGVLG